MDKAWWICRLVTGIISIVLAAAVFILEFCVLLVGSFSLNGPDGSEGKGFIIALIFLVSGILAITLNKAGKWPVICAGLYGLGFLIAAYQYSRYDYIYIFQSMSLYGLICLILCVIFLFSVCRTWKTALILAAVFLALIGTGDLVILIQRQMAERELQAIIEQDRVYEEKMLQAFDARTPGEIALDHLSYSKGMSKKDLILRLEIMDGMSHDTAQTLADSLEVDWGLHALYCACPMVTLESSYDEHSKSTVFTIIEKDEKKIRDKLSEQGFSEKEIEFAMQNLDVDHVHDQSELLSVSKYFSGLVYSDVDWRDYERYYEKYF